jgi:hypothetical protein
LADLRITNENALVITKQSSWWLVGNSYLGITSGLPVIQEFLPLIHISRLMRSQQAEERVHSSGLSHRRYCFRFFPPKKGFAAACFIHEATC